MRKIKIKTTYLVLKYLSVSLQNKCLSLILTSVLKCPFSVFSVTSHLACPNCDRHKKES